MAWNERDDSREGGEEAAMILLLLLRSSFIVLLVAFLRQRSRWMGDLIIVDCSGGNWYVHCPLELGNVKF